MSTPLTPADWARLEPLVDALLDSPPERRAVLLAEFSGTDPARRAQLERMVADCERARPLLEEPAAARFAALVDDHAVGVATALADRYRITRELGHGGMATVYLARDLRHSRDVAVKVVRTGLAAALGGGRFLREIEIAAALRHPHIVPLYDSGDADGVLYYVMPYEAGHSLRERLARDGPLPIDDAVLILRDICDALAHAHRHGIVHRDIKPDNVLLAGRHAMVTDFGVAKALSAAATGSANVADAERGGDRSATALGPTDLLTTGGVSLGTPAYMAPEQIAADPRIDHRADIYALGVLAYELLTGRPPFQADEPQLVLAAHLTQAPESLATHRPEAPPALAELVMKCLEKRPADRWQSADEMLARLERIVMPGVGTAPLDGAARVLAEPPPRSTPAPMRAGRRRTGVVLATAVVTLPLIFAIDRARRGDDAAPPLDARKIVVVPFRVSGVGSSLRDLGDGMVDLLAAKLNGEGGPLAVDPRSAISAWNRVSGGRNGTAEDVRRVAQMLGAGESLSGSIVGFPGNRITISASMTSTGGAARPAVSVSGPMDSLPALVDAVATRLVARQAGVTEQTLGTLTTASVPALWAYLWGRAEYRRGHETDAIEQFDRALRIDSTFALAALDLVVAAGQPLGMQTRCPAPDCLTTYFMLGFRNPGPESDHRRIARAVDVAWRHREKLGARDRPLLEALRGERYPAASPARAMLAALQRAATKAPDRVETQYLLGSLLLHQGHALEVDDSRALAAAAFNRALELDPAYVAPIAGLVDVAAFERDTAELRRTGALYLSRDSVGPTADYVRWRVAIGLGDRTALSSIRARFDALGTSTLQRIVHASVMSGLPLADAERSTAAVVRRASDRIERSIALGAAYMLAMNRGRPRAAARLLRLRSTGPDDVLSFWTWSAMAALFWDGDTALAVASARARADRIARDTLAASRSSRELVELSRHMHQQGLWDLMHGDTARAAAAVRWLRANGDSMGADFVDALLATTARRPDAEAIRSRIDSVMLEGCCVGPIVHWTNLVIARAHEAAGRDADALRAIRRGIWRFPPQLLSTFLREEGRLASRTGDRAGAIRAYRHYLALRSDPEPELRAEVDRVRAELARLERAPDRLR